MVGQQTGNLMAKRQRKDEARAETARLLLRLAAVASVLLPLPLQAASSATHAGLLDAPTLLMLGINVGVIAFAIATAIGCLRATERAKQASEQAAIEAERLRASENLLDTVFVSGRILLHRVVTRQRGPWTVVTPRLSPSGS